MTAFIKKVMLLPISLTLCSAELCAKPQLSCSTAQTTSECKKFLTDEPQNVRFLKQEIIAYHDSGMWEKARECIAQKAQKILQQYIPVGRKKLAVILDIDDTSLSSWDFNLIEDFGYNFKRYFAWENKGIMPPIKPILELYRFAQQHGFALFFITGRSENQREITEHNLLQAGFANWNDLFLRPPCYKGHSAREHKALWRQNIQNQGYTIVLNIGDQETDFTGYPQALYNLKLPNPMYIVP